MKSITKSITMTLDQHAAYIEGGERWAEARREVLRRAKLLSRDRNVVVEIFDGDGFLYDSIDARDNHDASDR